MNLLNMDLLKKINWIYPTLAIVVPNNYHPGRIYFWFVPSPRDGPILHTQIRAALPVEVVKVAQKVAVLTEDGHIQRVPRNRVGILVKLYTNRTEIFLTQINELIN